MVVVLVGLVTVRRRTVVVVVDVGVDVVVTASVVLVVVVASVLTLGGVVTVVVVDGGAPAVPGSVLGVGGAVMGETTPRSRAGGDPIAKPAATPAPTPVAMMSPPIAVVRLVAIEKLLTPGPPRTLDEARPPQSNRPVLTY